MPHESDVNPPSPVTDFVFTNRWFETTAKGVWDALIPQIRPKTILEIGSYEGNSACYLIENCAQATPIELHCVDTWQGGVEHAGLDMQSVEARFRHNTALAISRASHPVSLHVHKEYSHLCLAKLVAEGRLGHFDLIYVDGSHQAPDVLSDAVLAFHLLKVGGYLIFDDYLWAENLPYGKDPLRCPKPAIDAFVNIYFRKIRLVSAPLSQLYAQKTSD